MDQLGFTLTASTQYMFRLPLQHSVLREMRAPGQGEGIQLSLTTVGKGEGERVAHPLTQKTRNSRLAVPRLS